MTSVKAVAIAPIVDFTSPPKERSVAEQIASLSAEEKKAFDELRQWWDEKEREVSYNDYMILRLLRASPGRDKFNVKSAKKVAEKLATWSIKARLNHTTIRDIRAQLETGTLVITGGCNKDGHATLYMKPGLFFPGKDPLDELIRSLVYLLQCMSENETTATYGLSFIANLDGWGWSNFGVKYAKSFFDTMQGRFPCRVRQFIMYNAPDWFGMIWKIIRPMMSAEFAEKIVFLKNGDALKEFPSAEHVPSTMTGGKLNLDKQLHDFIKSRYVIESLDYNAPYPARGEHGHGEATADAAHDDD
jgi:CRAL/TRIO domain